MRTNNRKRNQSAKWLIDTINPHHRIGFINKDGVMVIEPCYDYAREFSEGLAAVGVKDRIGYIDTKGEMVIEPIFHDARAFKEGVAYVEQDKTAGYINKQGQWIFKINKELPCRPEYPPNFSEGLAVLRHGGKYRYFDKNGNVVFDTGYLAAQPFHDNLAAVYNDKEDAWEYIDKTCKVSVKPALPAIFANSFVQGHAMVQLRDMKRACYINRYGSIIHADEGTVLMGCHYSDDGIAPAMLKGKVGYIDIYGQFTIPPNFESAWPFHEGLGNVAVKRMNGYVNMKGDWFTIPFADYCGVFSQGLAPVRIVKKGCGYVNKQGTIVISPIYKDAWNFQEGLAAVRVK